MINLSIVLQQDNGIEGALWVEREEAGFDGWFRRGSCPHRTDPFDIGLDT
jgi:hypothetical protein